MEDTAANVEGDCIDSFATFKEPGLPVEDVVSPKEQSNEAIDFHENSTTNDVEHVADHMDKQQKPKLSKLPTPSQSLKNCSTFTRSVSYSLHYVLMYVGVHHLIAHLFRFT